MRLILNVGLITCLVLLSNLGHTAQTSKPDLLRNSGTHSGNIHDNHTHEYFDTYINDTNTQRRQNNDIGIGSNIPLVVKDDFDVDLQNRSDFNNENDNGKPLLSTMVVVDHKWEKGLLQDPKGGVKKLLSSLAVWNWFK